MSRPAPFFPPRIVPPAKPLGRFGFVATFLRNPLEVIPRAVYEDDFVPMKSTRAPRVWATSPALIRGVLVDERDKFRKLVQIRLLGPLLGSGILTSEGSDWRWQRAAASPMFKPEELAGFVPAFVAAAKRRLAHWGSAESVQPMDAEMTRATFDVIVSTLLRSSDETLAPSVHRAVEALQRSGGWDLLYSQLNMPPWMPRPGMMSTFRAMKSLRARMVRVIQERRTKGPEDDLTQRLIAARDPETQQSMDEERLVDNVLTFYLAGHETTAKALTWTLFLLSRSPEWAAALEREIAQAAGDDDITAAHLEKLVLTEQVLKESMRLYPPVPIMSRQAIADVVVDGHEVKAGTSVLIPIYAIHRHARRWPDADAFMPERFEPAREEAMPRYQYMPFGSGPRVCIGRNFAMMEAAAMLATFVRHARFTPVEGHEPSPVARVTLIPKGGMPLRVSQCQSHAKVAPITIA